MRGAGFDSAHCTELWAAAALSDTTAMPLLRHIIPNDDKSTISKLVRLRCLCLNHDQQVPE